MGHRSDAVGDSLRVIILPVTLGGASRGSRSLKRRPISSSPFHTTEIKEDNKKVRFPGSAKRKIRIE